MPSLTPLFPRKRKWYGRRHAERVTGQTSMCRGLPSWKGELYSSRNRWRMEITGILHRERTSSMGTLCSFAFHFEESEWLSAVDESRSCSETCVTRKSTTLNSRRSLKNSWKTKSKLDRARHGEGEPTWTRFVTRCVQSYASRFARARNYYPPLREFWFLLWSYFVEWGIQTIGPFIRGKLSRGLHNPRLM